MSPAEEIARAAWTAVGSSMPPFPAADPENVLQSLGNLQQWHDLQTRRVGDLKLRMMEAVKLAGRDHGVPAAHAVIAEWLAEVAAPPSPADTACS